MVPTDYIPNDILIGSAFLKAQSRDQRTHIDRPTYTDTQAMLCQDISNRLPYLGSAHSLTNRDSSPMVIVISSQFTKW